MVSCLGGDGGRTPPKTLRHQDNVILLSSMYEKIYLHDSLEGVLQAIQVYSLQRYPHNLQMIASPLQSSSPREKEKKGENSHKACMGTFSFDYSFPIYRHLVCKFFIKTLIIMSISTNIHRPFVCDPLGPYISLVNNSIDPIKPY